MLLFIVMLMVIGIITVQSALNGVTMKEIVAQKCKGVARLKEPELTLAPARSRPSPGPSSAALDNTTWRTGLSAGYR